MGHTGTGPYGSSNDRRDPLASLAASHVESWRDKTILGHRFHGVIHDHDLTMAPQEVIERVKCELVSSIVNRIMQELGPRIDKAISDAWKEPSTPNSHSFMERLEEYRTECEARKVPLAHLALINDLLCREASLENLPAPPFRKPIP